MVLTNIMKAMSVIYDTMHLKEVIQSYAQISGGIKTAMFYFSALTDIKLD